MIIITQDGAGIINSKNIIGFYINRCRIYVDTGIELGWSIGVYDNQVEAKEAFEMLKTAILSSAGIFYMPSCETVQQRLIKKEYRKRVTK